MKNVFLDQKKELQPQLNHEYESIPILIFNVIIKRIILQFDSPSMWILDGYPALFQYGTSGQLLSNPFKLI